MTLPHLQLPPALLAAWALAISFLPAAAGVLINEFVASNGTVLADENGDFEDWIELHNPGSESVDLGGWGLSDNPAAPFQWSFAPGTFIEPGGHLLVWASGKDRPGSQPLTAAPEEIDGLVVWLRADTAPFANGQAVTTWQDASGRGNHASQATASQRPTFVANAINGQPALSFNRGAAQQLFLPTTSFQGMSDLSDFTFLAVARWTGGVTSGLFGGYRGSNPANGGSSVFEISSTSGSLRLRLPSTIEITGGPGVIQNQWQVIGAAMDGPAAKARMFVDGRTAGEANGTPGLTRLANYERLPIGSSFDSNRTFGGQIAEVVIFNRSLSALERTALESHFAGKFRLAGVDSGGATQPHTNFRISATGETLTLTRPDGGTADQVGPVALATDRAYGRLRDEPSAWSELQTATPGAPNDSPPWAPPPAPVAFSHVPGVHHQPFNLALSHPDPSAVVIYTLDGSEPDIANLAGTAYQFRAFYNSGPMVDRTIASLTYQAPIPVVDRSPQPNQISLIATTADGNPTYLPVAPVRKATVVRARAYVNGRSGPTSAATYFISSGGGLNDPFPLVSVMFDEDGFFDYRNGIYVAGVDHVTSSGGRICEWGNFYRRGTAAERPGHFQFFENGGLAVDQGVGLRIHGNCSRRNPFKSIRIHGDRLYDPRDDMNHPFFSDPVPDATVPDNTVHKRLILRTPSLNEVSFARLYQKVYGGVGGRLRPVVKFFNGEYWGISYLRDRLDQHYLGHHYDLDPGNIAVVNIKYGHEVGSSALRVFDLDAGIPSDMDDFWAMRNFITGNNMANAANYAQATRLLDTASFIDHLILKIFAGDDHYAPEYIYWRARTSQDTGFGDGRWRVMIKDFDSTLFTPNYVTGLANGTHPRSFGYELFPSLLANPSFRHDFINRFADLLNSHFQPARFQSIIHAAFDEMAPAWGELSARWNNAPLSNPNRPFTTAQRGALLNWSNDHPPRQRTHIRQHFGIAANVNLTVQVSDPSHGSVRVNTLEISGDTPGLASQPYPWTGVYFHNVPVKLAARPAPGHRFVGWKLNGASGFHASSLEITATLTTATAFEAVFEPVSRIHRWDFEHPALWLQPTQTVGGGASLTVAPGPATEVLRNATAQGFGSAHLRLNNPPGATVTWALPTTGFEFVEFGFDTRRSSQGAGIQTLWFTLDGTDWAPLESYPVADADPVGKRFDFSNIPGVADNPHFAVRVTFAQGDGGTAGNHRFDQVMLTGVPLPGGEPPVEMVFDAAPSGAQSGAALGAVVVRLRTAGGQPAVSFNGPVTLSLSGNGVLGGASTVAAVNGTATFEELSITGSGSHALLASATGPAPASSAPIRVLALGESIIPQFIQGGQDALGENHDRVPFAWRARIDGLEPHATYRYANRVVLASDLGTSDGAGNMIFITGSAADWIRSTSSPGFLDEDLGTGHQEFTADGDGSFSGWFVTEPTGNDRFTPGNTVRFRLLLNDGANGTSAAHTLTTTLGARVIRFGTDPGDGTAIIGESPTRARRIAVLYDEIAGTSRPLAATPVEITGAGVDSRYASFYQETVATHHGYWGTILPNTLPGGLRRIAILPADGVEPPLASFFNADGFPGTHDPGGGTSPIFLPTNPATGPATFNQWRNLHFPDPAERTDAAISGAAALDSAGTANLFRYAFGLAPGVPAALHLPQLDPVANTFRFAFDPAKSDLAWFVRASPDCIDWSETLFDSRTGTPPAADPDGRISVPYPADRPQLHLRLELRLIE